MACQLISHPSYCEACLFETCIFPIIIIQLPSDEGLTAHQYMTAVRLFPNQQIPIESLQQQQSARTCGVISESFLPSGLTLVNWSETFFFKVDSPVCMQIIINFL